jgi:hypothetical protein
VADGASENEEGAAFAPLETVTVRPLTIVTGSGAPLPEKRATVG